jgi:predicted RecB family nuclease
MTKLISKNTFLTATTCPRLGWLAHHEQLSDDDSLDAEFRIMQGNEISKRSRRLFPSGLLVLGAMRQAIHVTSETIDMNSILFEPAFSVDGFGARADILIKDSDGWNLIEVKSGKESKQEYIDDVAYTAMVLSRSGLQIKKMSLMLVSDDYRRGMPDKKLFHTEDVTKEAREQVAEFDRTADALATVLNAPKPPEAELILECKHCDVFEECTGKGSKNHIFHLPRLLVKLFTELDEKGIYKIEDIPSSIKLTEAQKRTWQAVRTNKPVISPDLAKELMAVVWPAWYLDFETFSTVVPLYDDIAPYETIVTQYSIHKCSAPGVEEAHFEYLADPGRDCRRDIAESLINTMTGKGSIIVYSSYEQGIINGLAETYPDLAGPLKKLVGRMVDLCALLRSNYCHKDFKGSYSIKKVLPVMVPGLDYSDLEIKEGGGAMVLYAYMAMGRISDAKEIAQIRKNLLSYCKRDTWAMVKLHEVLEKIEC